MFGKHADLLLLRIIGTRAFEHIEGYTKKLEPRAWEGVRIDYDSGRPTFHVCDQTTRRITSSRNVSFFEKPSAVFPTIGALGEKYPTVSDFDSETDCDVVENYRNTDTGVASLEVNG